MLSDWRNWLFLELKGLFGRKPNDRAGAHSGWTIKASGAKVHLISKKNGESLDLSDVEADSRFQPGRNRNAVLEIGTGLGLLRRVAELRLPESQIRQMADLDLRSSTPIDPASVYIFPIRNVQKDAGSSYLAVKRNTFEELIARLRDISLRPAQIYAEGGRGICMADTRVLQAVGLRSRLRGPFDQLLKYASVCLIALFAGTIGHEYWRVDTAEQKLERELSKARASALEVRKQTLERLARIEKLEAMKQERQARAPVVAVWEELTRLVPDSAWVTNLSILKDDVTFSGFALSASGLIGNLDASKMFEQPALSGQVLRDPSAGLERFTITMKLQEK